MMEYDFVVVCDGVILRICVIGFECGVCDYIV